MTAPVFPFSPNWRTPIAERLEWLTEVVEARDLSESRTAWRSFPRRWLDYELLEAEVAAGKLDALLYAYQAGHFVLPIWTDPQRLSAPVTAGSNSIPITLDTYDFMDGGYAVIWQDESNFELLTIDTVDTDTAGDSYLNLTGVVADNWPASTRIYPARLARPVPDVGLERITAGVVGGLVSFELTNSASTATADATLYQGIEVNTRRPNRVQPLSINYQRKLQRFDDDTGPVTVVDQAGIPSLTTSHSYLWESREEVAAYREWLHQRAGRLAAFWQPQWHQDLIQAAPIGSGGTQLTIKAIGAAAYGLDPARQHIALRHRSGTWYYREVTDVESGLANTEILTLNSALGIAASPGDFTHITWLVLSRFDTDAINLAWHTASVVQSSVAMRSVRA